MTYAGTVTMSAKELDRLEVLGRVVERRLTQRRTAEQLGLSERQVRLCEAAGLDPLQLREPGRRIERGFFPALFQAAELLSGDRLVGLHAAGAWGARSMLGNLTESEETVGKALREIARFAPVAVDTLRIEIDEGPLLSWIRADLGAAATPHGR